ncbi:MAG: GTP-binding protein [Oscillospiraceae bacterium]|nr:GTP-binding protein [Oscillospiraceae bacterium]
MKFKKFIALICTFAFMFSNLINVHAEYYNMALVGDSKAGKTSVFKRMCEDTFDSEHILTIGASFHTLSTVSGNSVRIWDTAGREEYQKFIPLYLRGAKIVVICSDITCQDSINNIDKWKKMVEDSECSEDVMVVWMINKIDLEKTEDAVKRDEINDIASANGIKHIIYTSAKMDDGIKELKEMLCRLANEFFATETAVRKEAEANAAYKEAETNAALVKKLLMGTVLTAVAGAVIGTICLIRNWLVNNRPQSLPNNYEIKT